MIGDTFILTRPDDLVVMTVTFQDFTTGTGPDGRPTYIAGAGAALVLMLPVQVRQEWRQQPGTDLPPDKWVEFIAAQSSLLRFEPAPGTVVVPTVEGVLAAAATLPVSLRPPPPPASAPKPPPKRHIGPINVQTAPVPPPPEPTPTGIDVTLLELPVGITYCPVPADPADVVVLDHPVAPRLLGPTTALWQTELLALSGLRLSPTGWYRIGGEVPTGSPPLPRGPAIGPLADDDRQAIVENSWNVNSGTVDGTSAAVLARIDRLRLSTLGGTLTAQGSWPDLTWQHDIALGRERLVRVTERGHLFPFGHAATRIAYAERRIDAPANGPAVVHVDVTVLADPVRDLPDDDSDLAHRFPFHRVEILTPVLDGLAEIDTGGSAPIPLTRADTGAPVEIPVRIHGTQGPFETAVQMYFIPAGAEPSAQHAHTERPLDGWSLAGLPVPTVSLPAVPIDLVRAATPLAADIHEVHALTFGAAPDVAAATNGFTAFRPIVTGLKVDLKALRTMLPAGATTVVDAVLSADLQANGARAAAVLDRVGTLVPGKNGAPDTFTALVVDFNGAADRSGALVTPTFVADTVGRELGPISADLLGLVTAGAPKLPTLPNLRDLFKGSKLLGLDLASILPDLTKLADPSKLPIPTIVQDAQDAAQAAAGLPTSVTMSWTGLQPGSTPSFLPGDDVSLDLTATASPTAQSVTCTLRGFTLQLPNSDEAILSLAFKTITFTAVKGTPPKLAVGSVTAQLKGALELLEKLQDSVDLGDAGQVVHVDQSGITASYALSVPDADAGMFLLRNIDFRTEVDVPFDGTPPSVSVRFASRDNPFTLAVLAFGGGGYVDLLVDTLGVKQFEASLDFAAQLAVDFVVAAGEVHAMGGVEFDYDRATDQLACTGFLRFGGSLSVLHVVTVSVELRIDLTYADKVLSGSASLVIDVDVTVWSDSVTLNTGTVRLAGGSGPVTPQAVADDDQLAAWREYRAAFAA